MWVPGHEVGHGMRKLRHRSLGNFFRIIHLINCYNQNLNPHGLALGPAFYLALVILNVQKQILNLHLNMSVNCVNHNINRWFVKLDQAINLKEVHLVICQVFSILLFKLERPKVTVLSQVFILVRYTSCLKSFIMAGWWSVKRQDLLVHSFLFLKTYLLIFGCTESSLLRMGFH